MVGRETERQIKNVHKYYGVSGKLRGVSPLRKDNNMNKKLISLIAGVAIVAAATGCSGTATSSVAGTDSSAAGTSASEASSAAAEELSGTLSMNGSTSMEKVIKAVNGAFMEKNKGVTVNLNLTGSGTGIQEASEGKCDIGNSSRKLKDEEAEKLDATVVGLDGIALVVNPANKLEDITLEDLAKVYSGEITNWKELGGDDKFGYQRSSNHRRRYRLRFTCKR